MLDDRGYVAEMITEIGVELSRRLEASEEPLEGAEAAAALAEDADCSRRSGEPPLVSADQFRRALHELRGKLVSALRDVATRRRAAREAEEDEGKEPLPELRCGDDDVRPKCMLSIFARSSRRQPVQWNASSRRAALRVSMGAAVACMMSALSRDAHGVIAG
jgi:hypothetical protein